MADIVALQETHDTECNVRVLLQEYNFESLSAPGDRNWGGCNILVSKRIKRDRAEHVVVEPGRAHFVSLFRDNERICTIINLHLHESGSAGIILNKIHNSIRSFNDTPIFFLGDWNNVTSPTTASQSTVWYQLVVSLLHMFSFNGFFHNSPSCTSRISLALP